MSREFVIKGVMAVIMSLVFAWGIFSRCDEEYGKENSTDNRQKYLPYISGNLLPLCILAVAIFGLLFKGVQETSKLIVSVCFGVFLHTSLYYIVLIMAMPLFRKHMSARTCAALWMLPNFLYVTFYDFAEVREPLVVFQAPRNVVWMIFWIWLAGFLIVFWGNIFSHLVFRSKLLKDAKEVTNMETLEIWNEKLQKANMQYKKYPLLISGNAKTPLSVGLFRRRTCVVLPEKDYAPEELELIFQHEIVHIGREDGWSKFFLMFCTAICWFNPLMWIAMRKSADDLELSCDETVLLDADDETRRRYAGLILNTAGDERGFTTCLSASASAMRYRLKNIMKAKMRRSGVVAVGITFFALFMSYGYVALAYGESTGREIVYQSEDVHSYKVDQLYFTEKDREYNILYECMNEEALHEYISKLTMTNLTGQYTFSDRDKELCISYDTPKGDMYVVLAEHVVRITTAYEKEWKTYWYYVAEEIDWTYLEEIIIGYPALNVLFLGENDFEQTELSATIGAVKKQEAEESLIVYEKIPEASASGLYSAHSCERAILNFSQEVLSGCTIEIRTYDGELKETILRNIEGKELEIPLVQYSADYSVYAQFSGTNQEIYEVEFQFHIGEFEAE